MDQIVGPRVEVGKYSVVVAAWLAVAVALPRVVAASEPTEPGKPPAAGAGPRVAAPEGTAAGLAARAASRTGGLHRVAAVLEATLDIHRLALVELIAASRKILEAGQRPDANPGSPLPAAAAEVVARLSTTVPARIPADALPAVSRAYEAEAVEALGDLGRASRLGLVLEPLRGYARSVGRLLGGAEEVIDLYSRARPIETRVVDPSYVLDDINDALDELARAEAGVARVRNRVRSNGEQLQAFMRLELALGHALDLIAEAQEAGIHIGFEAPVSTATLSSISKAVRGHLDELSSVIDQLAKAPAPVAGSVEALIGGDAPPYEARVSWQAPDPARPPAALRVYRVPSKREALAALGSRLACASGDERAARAAAERQLEHAETEPVLVGELAPGRASISDTLGAPVYAAPRYHVVPVSAFGVEGNGPEARALYLPGTLEAPPLVSATLASRNPAEPAFYTGGDLVEVRWEPSRSELGSSPVPAGAAEWARQQKLPVVERYRVLRISGGAAVEVAVVPATVHALSDRPAWPELGRGVSYLVESVSAAGRAAQTPGPCSPSEVKGDVEAAFGEAAAGVAHLRRPTRLERARLLELARPETLHAALEAFAQRSTGERRALLETWWQELSPASRIELLDSWPDYVSPTTQLDWLLEGVDHLSTRDRPWVVTELWLATQPPYMQREVDRWWALLDSTSQREAVARWRAHLDRRHDKWVTERLAVNDASVLRPAKVAAWWGSRDPGERERIEDWWAGASSEDRRKLYRDWLADQPVAVKVSVRWPDWAWRSDAERSVLLADAYRDLPDGLMIHVLAWLPWHELRGDARAAAIRAEIGPLDRVTSRARYGLRPVDRALGFHLWAIAASIAILLPVGAVVYRGRKKRRPHLRQGGA